MNDSYRDLLALAAKVPAPPAGDGGAAQQQLDAACADHIRELLRDGGDPGEIVAFLNADLDGLAAAPGADPRAVQRLRDSMMARFEAQARKNAVRRRTLAAIPFVLVAVILIGYLTLKFANTIGMHHPVDSREGIVERARALQKIIYYDHLKLGDFQDRRMHTALVIYYWPIEPTDGEIAGAQELLKLAGELNIELHDKEHCSMAGEGGFLPGERSSLGLELFANQISYLILSKEMKWAGTPRDSLREVVRTYQCYNYDAIKSILPH